MRFDSRQETSHHSRFNNRTLMERKITEKQKEKKILMKKKKKEISENKHDDTT